MRKGGPHDTSMICPLTVYLFHLRRIPGIQGGPPEHLRGVTKRFEADLRSPPCEHVGEWFRVLVGAGVVDDPPIAIDSASGFIFAFAQHVFRASI